MSIPNPNNRILSVGSMAFDSIETPVGKVDKVLGGSVNYFSIAASFYSSVSIVAVVGEDFPDNHLGWLKERGVDTSGVQKAAGKTFHWKGKYTSNMNEAQTLDTQLNVFERFSPKLEPKHQDTPYVFLANIHPALQGSVLNQIQNPEFVALDTMNLWINTELDTVKEVLSKVDFLCINEEETFALSGEKNIINAAEKIRSWGPKVFVIKRGEYGAALFTDNGCFLIPGFPTNKLTDPTGAGDTFAGAMVGYLARAGFTKRSQQENSKDWEKTVRRAVVAGCVMASFTVEDFSIHRLMKISNGDLEARLDEFLKIIRADF